MQKWSKTLLFLICHITNLILIGISKNDLPIRSWFLFYSSFVVFSKRVRREPKFGVFLPSVTSSSVSQLHSSSRDKSHPIFPIFWVWAWRLSWPDSHRPRSELNMGWNQFGRRKLTFKVHVLWKGHNFDEILIEMQAYWNVIGI